jgi:hypothetical protein
VLIFLLQEFPCHRLLFWWNGVSLSGLGLSGGRCSFFFSSALTRVFRPAGVFSLLKSRASRALQTFPWSSRASPIEGVGPLPEAPPGTSAGLDFHRVSSVLIPVLVLPLFSFGLEFCCQSMCASQSMLLFVCYWSLLTGRGALLVLLLLRLIFLELSS